MKSVLCVLILVLAFSLPSYAELHISTESEREDHLNIAVSNIAYYVPDIDMLIFRNSINITRQNFLNIYHEHWENSSIPENLKKAVNESINARTKKMLWGTKSLQLGLNAGRVINKIQENIASKISGEYNSFLRDVESDFMIELQNELDTFHNRVSSIVIASSKNPIVRAYLRKNLHVESADINVNLKMKKQVDISKFQEEFKAYIGRYVGKAEAYKALTSGAAGKIINDNIPVVGKLLLAWSIYDIASMAWNAESDVRRILHERNQSIYSSELPLVYWDVMEGYIIDSFIQRYIEIYDTRKKAFEFANDPRILERYAEMNEAERINFADELMNQ